MLLPGPEALPLAVYLGWLLNGMRGGLPAIVVQAVVPLARRSLGRSSYRVIASCAFLALALLAVPFPVVVVGAGVAGWLVRHRALGVCALLGLVAAPVGLPVR